MTIRPAGLWKGVGIPTGPRTNTFILCEQCGAYHRIDFTGDCREDSERYADLPDGAELREDEDTGGAMSTPHPERPHTERRQTGQCPRCGHYGTSCRCHRLKLHYRDPRQGLSVPLCYSMTIPLDATKVTLPTTGDLKAVTCKRCRALEQHFRSAPEPDPLKLWASYVSNTAHGVNGITLHSSYRAALETVADFYDVEDLDKSDEQVYQEIEEAAGSEDWYIGEVELP